MDAPWTSRLGFRRRACVTECARYSAQGRESPMFRLLGSAIVAAALLLIPVGISIQVSDHALAQATDKADTAEKGKAKTAKQKKKRELTKGQKSARERQRQCGQEWREAKKAGKI